MKKAQPFIGLSVMGIDDGEQLGKVAGFIVNPDSGRVDYLLLERELWYGEMKAMNYDAVLGVGEFAVMTGNGKEIYAISERPEIVALLEKGVQLVNAGVVTRSGEYVGVVAEYIIDEKTGNITGCEISGEGADKILGIVPADKVITYGAKYIVIEDGPDKFLVREISDIAPGHVPALLETHSSPQPAAVEEKPAPEPAAVEEKSAPEPSPVEVKTEVQEETDPVELFEARQRQYLLGKKTAKKITGAGGKVIVEEGVVVTNDIIESAVAEDKYIELTMNVK